MHPYLLKEFRNRWFLIGRTGTNKTITTYGLERIKAIKNSDAEFIPNDLFDPFIYYENVVGVTVYPGDVPQKIHIKAFPSCVPYIKTKPIHKHQKSIKDFKDGSVLFELNVIVNFELKSILLSYGEGIEIKKPSSLRAQIKSELKKMSGYYKTSR